MSDDELRAAAEEVIDQVNSFGGYARKWEVRAAAVARAYLADHPADDGEAVLGPDGRPPAWWTPDLEASLGNRLFEMERDPNSVLKTVGQLRRLCRALGVPLTPTPEQPPCDSSPTTGCE